MRLSGVLLSRGSIWSISSEGIASFRVGGFILERGTNEHRRTRWGTERVTDGNGITGWSEAGEYIRVEEIYEIPVSIPPSLLSLCSS